MKKDGEINLLLEDRRKGTSQKLAAACTGMSELPEHISRFLELLRQGAEQEPQPF